MYLIIFQRLFGEALLDFVYFPVWWYSGGAKQLAIRAWGWAKSGNRTLAPGLWLQNIFVPMFGQTDWQGKIISFFMRAVQVVARSLALVAWIVACLALFLFLVFLPIIAIFCLVVALMPKT